MFGRCNGVMFAPGSIARQFDEVFDSVAPATRTAQPALNVWEDDKAVYVEAALPGFRMQDVEVTLERQVLTIRGSRSQDDAEGKRWLHRERSLSEFERTVSIREMLDAERVSATMKDGVLIVTLPKSAAAQPRKININPSGN